MSHIFDALQRSEAEQSGTESPLAESTFPVATDLARTRGAQAPDARADRSLIAKWRARSLIAGTSMVRRAIVRSRQLLVDQFPSLPVSIPPDSRLVSVGEEESLGAEKFRFLAVRLRHLRQSRPLKKVLITSTIPQEGKSTVAANLACTLARRKQHKTLLLEGDLRRPAVAAKFGLRTVPGLMRMASWRDRKQKHLPAGSSGPLDPAGRQCTGKSARVNAIGETSGTDGGADCVV